MTVQGNVLENNWVSAQSGWSVILRVGNENGLAPWAVAEDIQITENVIRRSPMGVDILGRDDNLLSEGRVSRVTIRNNLFQNIDGWAFLVYGGADSVTIDHNTSFQRGNVLTAEGPANPGFVFTNNLMPYNANGIAGSGIGGGTNCLEALFPGYVFTRNVLIAPPYPVAGSFPPGNYFPLTTGEAGFVDLAGGNYRLSSGSPYYRAGTDGKDIGADIDAIAVATGLSLGTPASVPPPPTPPPPAPTPAPPPEVQASIDASPSRVTLRRGETQRFRAGLTGLADSRVVWSISPADEGAISQDGVYRAPRRVQSCRQVTILCTSVAQPKVSGAATVTLRP